MRTVRALAAIATLLLPAATRAQSGALQVEQYEPLPAGSGILNVPTSGVLPHGAWAADLWVGWSRDALGLQPAGEGDERTAGAIVPNTLRTELVLGFGLLDLAEVAVGVPWSMSLGGGTYGVAGRSADDLAGGAEGDVRLVASADLRTVRDIRERLPGGMGVGASLAAWLPTGDTVRFEGEGAVRLEPRLFADWGNDLGIRVAASFGYHVRPESKVFSYVNDDALRWSLAASTPTGLHALEVVASVFGSHVLASQPDPTDLTQTLDGRPYDPVEALLGVRVGLPLGLEVTAAVGKGLTSGIGAPTLRGLVQVGRGWPEHRGRFPSYYAVRDSDGDGLTDLRDDCPREAERFDGRRDEDGCPEAGAEVLALLAMEAGSPGEAPPVAAAPAELEALPDLPPLTPLGDGDGDGVDDDNDGCPEVAEDVDGFEDNDGCPEPDDDRDGIADADDRCRSEAETPNGFEDEDGCPDLGSDADADGVGDFDDVCPREPENLNGVRDWDGCPEADLEELRKELAALVAKPQRKPKPISRLSAALPRPVDLPPLTRLVDTDGDGLTDDIDDCPEEPEDDDEFEPGDGCPDPDDDGDGIPDADDKCRYEAETLNEHEDEDGCPDLGPDTDGDGVGDFQDVCPLEAETTDGVRDWDGCPEADVATLRAQVAAWEAPPEAPKPKPEAKPKPPPKVEEEPPPPDLPPLEQLGDKDGDGLDAIDDACPEEPEDLDGLADLDGCPEDDFDADGVPDEADRCPQEAEITNGFQDDDGCPDEAPKAIDAVSGVVEKIRYKVGSADLLPSSLPTLRKVAKVLQDAGELRLRILGHTDVLGSREANLKLSQARAESVRNWLIEQGISPDRLEAKGLGEKQVLTKARYGKAAAKNRRVELQYQVQEDDEGKPE